MVHYILTAIHMDPIDAPKDYVTDIRYGDRNEATILADCRQRHRNDVNSVVESQPYGAAPGH